jgi:DNA-binding NarL/FixJ family response regulator
MSRLVKPITVLVAARADATRASCARALAMDRRLRIVGHARGAVEAVTVAAKLRPRVVVVERDRGGVLESAVARLKAKCRVIVVDGRATAPRVVDALALGAHGHVALTSVEEWLPRAVRVVDAGQAWIPRRLVATLLRRLLIGASPARAAR